MKGVKEKEHLPAVRLSYLVSRCVTTVLVTSESVLSESVLSGSLPRMFKNVPGSCLVLPSVCSTLSAAVFVFLTYVC